jgi:hypothetical protein
MDEDPFLIQPEIWFAVLCESVGWDDSKRIDLKRVFNRTYFTRPPDDAGIPPHAHLKSILAVGLSAGVGDFSGTIHIENVDGQVLQRFPNAVWTFRMGPGETMGATFFASVEHWFTEEGVYFVVVTVQPGAQRIPVRIEVAERQEAHSKQPDPPETGTP